MFGAEWRLLQLMVLPWGARQRPRIFIGWRENTTAKKKSARRDALPKEKPGIRPPRRLPI
jgi:hypothetical protein